MGRLISIRVVVLNLQRKQRWVQNCTHSSPHVSSDSAVCTHVFGDGLFCGVLAYKNQPSPFGWKTIWLLLSGSIAKDIIAHVIYALVHCR